MRETFGNSILGWQIHADFGAGLKPIGTVRKYEVEVNKLKLVYVDNHEKEIQSDIHALVWEHHKKPDKDVHEREIKLVKRLEAFQDAGLNPPPILRASRIVFVPPPPPPPEQMFDSKFL